MIDLLAALYNAEYNIPLPITLPLTDQTQFIGNTVLRIVPKKRIVLAGLWQERPAVAKLFLQKNRAIHHAEREQKGLQALRAIGIETPEIYYSNWTEPAKIYALIFQYCDNAPSFQNMWTTAETTEQKVWLDQLIQLTAHLHNNGIYQADCHLDNFLCETIQNNDSSIEYRIIMLDGASVSSQAKPLDVNTSLDNLALILAQFPQNNPLDITILLSQYLSLRHWENNAITLPTLTQKIADWQNKREKIYLEKTLRSSSAYICNHSWNHTWILDRTYNPAELQQVLEEPGAFFYKSPDEIFQDGDTESITFNYLNYDLLIVRYKISKFWQNITQIYTGTQAHNTWLKHQKDKFSGKSSHKPIALIEKHIFFIPLEGYIIYLS